MNPVLHITGPYVDMVQLCARCGAVLLDYRNAAWPADSDPPRGFVEGAFLYERGGFQSLFSTDDGKTPPCATVN